MIAAAGSQVRRGAVPAKRPFVAVAATLNRRRDQWHTGIAYADDELEVPRFLHLAGDKQLLDERLDDEGLGWEQGYVWIEVPVLPEKARALVQLCRSVSRRVETQGQEVRYAVRHYLGRFDAATGAYIHEPPEHGLTCATCVMAVCRGAEIELVDVTSWPVRPEDQRWLNTVVAWLRKSDPAHAEAVASDGLCARFRPTEVAGACLVPALKVSCDDAVRAAAVVAERYDSYFL
jgi:hypothetical protein